MKRFGVIGILLLAFFGLADSLYLAQHVASAAPLICNIQNLSDCNVVASSQYSRIFGIPVAELGVLFYGTLFVLAALELFLFDRLLRRVLQGAAIIGLTMSVYSTIVQIFFIKALCVYCLASALFTLIIFILATLIEPIKRAVQHIAPQSPPPLSMPPAS